MFAELEPSAEKIPRSARDDEREKAFIHLLANPGEWIVQHLAKDPDPILLHSLRRASLQTGIGVRLAGAYNSRMESTGRAFVPSST